jgi:hypothetical protein
MEHTHTLTTALLDVATNLKLGNTYFQKFQVLHAIFNSIEAISGQNEAHRAKSGRRAVSREEAATDRKTERDRERTGQRDKRQKDKETKGDRQTERRQRNRGTKRGRLNRERERERDRTKGEREREKDRTKGERGTKTKK